MKRTEIWDLKELSPDELAEVLNQLMIHLEVKVYRSVDIYDNPYFDIVPWGADIKD